MPFSSVKCEDPTPQGIIISPRQNGSTASSIGCSVSAPSSDYLNGLQISSLHQGTTGMSISGPNSDPRPMLPSSASGLTPAQLVHQFCNSPYVMEQSLEPTDNRRRSILLQLLRETPNLPRPYECIFPGPDGAPCGKTFKRPDRGLTHIRTHFNHRPFHCNGVCGRKNW